MNTLSRTICLTILFSLLIGFVKGQSIFPALSEQPVNENRINLVILGDGYLSGQVNVDNFLLDGNAVIQALAGNLPGYNASPFTEYLDYFQTYRIFVSSTQQGIHHPCTGTHCISDGCSASSTVNNAWGMTMDHASLHRYMFIRNEPPSYSPENVVSQVQTIINNATAPMTILVIGNTLEFGGGAKPNVLGEVGIATIPRYEIAREESGVWIQTPFGAEKTAVHEMGHSFASLRDEYYYHVDNDEGPNKTADSNGDTWADWLPAQFPATTIGIHQHHEVADCPQDLYNANPNTVPWPWDAFGGQGNLVYFNSVNYFKPTTNYSCKMERSDRPFCAVCREAIIERIHEQVNPIDGFSPINSDALPASSTLVFDVDLIEPNPSWMQVKWYVNDVLVETIEANGAAAGATDFSWQFDCSNAELQDGTNTIKAVVFDHTGNPDPENDTRMVRKASHAAHVHEVEWTVNWDAASVETDLYVKDVDEDTGEDPGYAFGWFFDESPDIKVQNAPMTGTYAWSDIVHENPNVALSPAYVYVRISNRGCQASTGGTLGVYNTTVSSATSWEDGNWQGTNNLGYQIGSDATIPAISGNAEAILELEWVITDITPGGYINWNTCILARLEDVPNDPIVPPTPLNITEWVSQLGNIAMHNVSVIDLDEPGIISVGGKGYAGGHVYVGTTRHATETLDIHFDVDDDKVSKTLNEEAEIVVGFVERGWDVSGAIVDSMLHGLTRLDSTLFLVTNEHAWISNLQIPADSLVPAFVGFGFLTQEVSDTMNYAYHLSQYRTSAKDTVLAAQHFHIKRVSRNLFSANAGADVELLAGDSITLSATSIGESADYNWYNAAGTLLASTQTIKVSPSSTSTFTLEVIADADAYRDYDEVVAAVTNGQITSVVPNPTSTTTVVAYAVVNVTTAAIRVVQVNTSTEMNNYTVSVGSGTQTINATGYASGAYLIQLKGDGNVLDTSTLIVQ